MWDCQATRPFDDHTAESRKRVEIAAVNGAGVASLTTSIPTVADTESTDDLVNVLYCRVR